jgi:hypothetical protein
MSLIQEVGSSEAIEWLNLTLKECARANEGKPPPPLDELRRADRGELICEIPPMARWYFRWGLDLKEFQRKKVPHAEGFQCIEASVLMRLGWYETYLKVPAGAVAQYMNRAFWTFDICKGGYVVGVTMPQFRNMRDTFTTMPR